jgi:phenylalanine-4-hydroxylase
MGSTCGADELDYLKEPDITMSSDMFPCSGFARSRSGALPISRGSIGTVEFGLLETSQGLRIYGAGIASSKTETIFALSSDSPNRLGFDLERVMRTLYRIDDFQQVYFVIPSLNYLLDVTTGTDFDPLIKISNMPDIPIGAIEPSDKVFARSTQEYARSGGRLRQGAA